ncbi:hypothetical protein CR513_02103, partial [Mucuna pruriens]
MRTQGILEDYIKMKAFPFSLDGAAKDWLYLQLVMFNTWGDMKRMFLEKFFPASRTTTILKEICRIRQHLMETWHKYWERFAPPDQRIVAVAVLYEGLLMMDGNMVDAANRGDLMDKTPAAARHLILNMESNTQQFGIRGGVGTSRVSKLGKPVDGAHISSEASRCRPAPISRATSMWDLCLDGAPYSYVPHFAGVRDEN